MQARIGSRNNKVIIQPKIVKGGFGIRKSEVASRNRIGLSVFKNRIKRFTFSFNKKIRERNGVFKGLNNDLSVKKISVVFNFGNITRPGVFSRVNIKEGGKIIFKISGQVFGINSRDKRRKKVREGNRITINILKIKLSDEIGGNGG